jgi:hypothetical protein
LPLVSLPLKLPCSVSPLITVNGEALFWLSGLALSPDGKRLLFAQPEPRKDEIMLMENFR